MSRKSVNLLVDMGSVINFIGPSVKAAGWYGPTEGVHTVAIRTRNLRGRITLQGTIAVTPQDADWFVIPLSDNGYLEYPRTIVANPYGGRGDSSTLGFTFNTNSTFLRVLVDRSYLINPFATEEFVSLFGTVDSVVVNF